MQIGVEKQDFLPRECLSLGKINIHDFFYQFNRIFRTKYVS
jgi:hypothetical protein